MSTIVSSILNKLISAQHNRILRMDFPRNDGPAGIQMLANQLSATERVSKDFEYIVEVLSDNAHLELKQLLGKMVTISLVREDGTLRYFNGYVFIFELDRADGGLAYYRMVLRPWLAFLALRKDNYLFHGKTLAEQTQEIFADYDVRDWASKLQGTDQRMTDACQFDESDYNYLHRRWEARGWYYWYEHRADGHTLVLADDSPSQCPVIDGEPFMQWQDKAGSLDDDGISRFAPVRALAPGYYSIRSFDFKNPRPLGTEVPTLNRQGDVPALEVYEYTGSYGFKDRQDGDAQVRLRMEEIEVVAKRFEARSNDRFTQPGRHFTLRGHFDFGGIGTDPEDAQFLILDVYHHVRNNYEMADGASSEYTNFFTCLRKKIPWRPHRSFNSTEPKIYALQTAIVTGPKGEEIHTDEYGRVRVQFHWDREGGYDEKSSAWVRVASTWAGSNFGFMAVPRIGQEVIVQWLDGNPDRPLITGRVYNQHNMPPWELPANKTQTGMLSRSSHGGQYENANALRFEDKKGQEEVWLHAEKDQRIEVENDESHWVGHDRKKTVDHDETVHVKHDRTETVDNNETITIGVNRTEKVGANEKINIGANRSVTIGGNKAETVAIAKAETIGAAKALSIGAGYAVTVGGAMNTAVGLAQFEEVGLNKTVMVGKKYSINAGDELEITVGKSTLVMKSDGTVLINGTKFDFSASGPVQISGKDVDVN